MKIRETRTALDLAVNALRKIVLERAPGDMIGSEDALIAATGYSRTTVRQAARLLEREGLLRVRRGINGGYFGTRPDAATVAATVSAYLEYIEVDSRDVTILASALWVEAMRKAADAGREDDGKVATALMVKVKALKNHVTFEEIRDLELLIQSEIFKLARSTYVKLIFDINLTFSRIRFNTPLLDDSSEGHLRFVRAWRDAKLLELSAILEGDRELAAMAGVHSRKIWHQRILARHEADQAGRKPPAGT